MRTTPAAWAGDLALWSLVAVGMLTVNSPLPISSAHAATFAIGLGAAAVLGRMYPPAAVTVTVFLAQGEPRFYAAVVLAAFLAGRRSTDGPGLPGRLAALIVPALVGAWIEDPLPTEFAVLPAELLMLAVLPWLVGRYRHQWVALHERGWERAARLERERDLVEERTRLRERARIAQDMHDSLGHDLSLLALRAAAFELDRTLGEEQRERAGELRAGAGAATQRLHEIIGVLRESDESAPADPVHEDPAALVERCRASGMVVRYTVVPAQPTPIPPMVALAVHRIAQESLTNAAKHAPGAVVRVTVTHVGDLSTVEVANGPAVRVGDVAPTGSGYGLVGMRERARLLGGTLDAAPTDDGFRVVARLPHHAAPASPDTAAGRFEQGRRLRRGFVKALAWTGAGVVLAASAYAFSTTGAAVAPEDYDRMRIGQTRAELAATLPDDQYRDRPESEPPIPADARCEYYTNGDVFPSRVFRLCFAHDVLVAKDVVPLERRRDATRP
ncbi:sensor histidine kinase [Embleya sp. NBC_00896]|uniref:sensor histidine kinase n=1 Tax=Embleya sp. NBC_00896 TaxID=2975961 RepID=UPI00386D15C9|nr:histidine kinase [Embleya sp. NBC_00896]